MDDKIIISSQDFIFFFVSILFSVETLIVNLYYGGIPIDLRQWAFLALSNLVWILTIMLVMTLKELIFARMEAGGAHEIWRDH